MKIQEVTSDVAITEKKSISDKSCRYTRVAGSYTDKVMPDIDYFTDEPVVQYGFPVIKKYFCRLLHKNDTNDNRYN